MEKRRQTAWQSHIAELQLIKMNNLMLQILDQISAEYPSNDLIYLI